MSVTANVSRVKMSRVFRLSDFWGRSSTIKIKEGAVYGTLVGMTSVAECYYGVPLIATSNIPLMVYFYGFTPLLEVSLPGKVNVPVSLEPKMVKMVDMMDVEDVAELKTLSVVPKLPASAPHSSKYHSYTRKEFELSQDWSGSRV